MAIPKVSKNRIYYRTGYKYQLACTYKARTQIKPKKDIHYQTVHLTKGGQLTIDNLDACDGPSGPTRDSSHNMRAAWEHDAFMKLFRSRKLPRKWLGAVNRRFRSILIKDGMSRLRAWYYFKGGSFGSIGASKPKNLKKVYTSP